MLTRILVAAISFSGLPAFSECIDLDSVLETIEVADIVDEDVVDRAYRMYEDQLVQDCNSSDQVRQLLRLHIFLMENDPSNYASDLLGPFSRRYSETFEQVLLEFPDAERELVMDGLNVYFREERFGQD